MPNVIVTNKNDDAYCRKFDGKLYEFEPGKAVTIPEAAAAYLFAYGKTDADRQRIVVRNGWQKNGIQTDPWGPKAAMKRLQNFVFNAAPEEPAAKKPEKKIAPSQLKQPGGINAMSELADANGLRKPDAPRASGGTLHLPGNKAAPASRLPPA